MNLLKTTLICCVLFFYSLAIIGQNTNKNLHQVTVLEVLQVNSYTYLFVNEDGTKKWLAVPSLVTKVGDTLYYKGGMKMTDFKSKELNKTFKSVVFLQNISNSSDGSQKAFTHTIKKPVKVDNTPISVKPQNGSIRIEELLKNKEKYNGKIVKIRGKVTKFNSQIMSKNWIHLQDGSSYNGEFDLTITTSAQVNVGDVITIEGKVSLEKDFGYGYFYGLIIENAVILK
ncbi:hypothetical protein [Lutibacter sp.]